jgi:hypothetical protein
MIPKNLKSQGFHWVLMSILIISSMLYSASTFPTCSANVSSSATVFVDPPQSIFNTATVGTSFVVNVTVANITGLLGAQFTLSWNTTLLTCTKLTEILYHTVTPEDSWSNIWSIKSSINKTGGYANYAQTFQDSSLAIEGGYAPVNITTANYPPEGKLALASLTFNVTAVPPTNKYYECNLTLSDVIMGDGGIPAVQIPTTNVDAHYIIYGPPETLSHSVVKDSTTYKVTTVSNASVVQGSMTYIQNYKISLNVTGAEGTTAYVNVTIPKNLVDLANPTDAWNVTVDGTPATPTVTENATHTFLYFTTSLSTKTVTIVGTIPEFPTLMVIPLLMIVTLIAVGLRRRRQT